MSSYSSFILYPVTKFCKVRICHNLLFILSYLFPFCWMDVLNIDFSDIKLCLHIRFCNAQFTEIQCILTCRAGTAYPSGTPELNPGF